MPSKVFKRNELKYLITKQQFDAFKIYIDKYLEKDNYHKSTIKNIYYDTDDYLLIRRSIEKPQFKEKIRIRTYEEGLNPKVFVEIKRKYNSDVYKRRAIMLFDDAISLLNGKEINQKGQIINEIKYMVSFYKTLKPKMYLSYNRLSYRSIKNTNLRITFDSNILCDQEKTNFINENIGKSVLDENLILMEVKTDMGYPEWLNNFLNQNKIYKMSFSKYGTAYKQLIKEKEYKYGSTLNIA